MSPSQAHANLAYDYEVRLQLDPTLVLDSNHELAGTVLTTFKASAAASAMNVQFLDTCGKDIYAAGWNVRVRKADDKPSLEVTYKKRYGITDGNIEAALNTANADGFNGDDPKWEAQVEWGQEKQTLSISRSKKSPSTGNDKTHLPDKKDSRALLIKEAPGKFDDWGSSHKWGTSALARLRIYGPILAKRYTGIWNNEKLYIEVWPIRDSSGSAIDYIVEASFKTDSNSVASTEQGSLRAHLQTQGWLIAEDALKTQIILERYGCSDAHEGTN